MDRFFVAAEVEARARHGHFFAGSRDRGRFPGLFFRGRPEPQLHLLQEVQSSFLRVVFGTYGLTASTRKRKGHRLIRFCGAGGTVKNHAVSHDMYDLGRHFGIFCQTIGVSSTLQIDLYFAAASDAAVPFCGLAALRLHDVMALAGLAENRDFHVFEQARFHVFEIRRLRCLDGKNFAGPIHFGKCKSAGLFLDIERGGRGRLPAVDDSLPAALQIHACRQACQQQRHCRGPARIPRCFAPSHGFS